MQGLGLIGFEFRFQPRTCVLILGAVLTAAACDFGGLAGASEDAEDGKTFQYGDYDRATAVEPTEDGGLVLAGETGTGGATGEDEAGDVLLLKTTGEGEEKWHTTFSFGAEEKATGLAVTADEKFVLAGTVETWRESNGESELDDDVFLLQTDAAGTKLWSTQTDVNAEDEAHAVVQDSSGGFLVVASTTRRPDSVQTQMLLLKYAPGGEHRWTKTVSDANDIEARAVARAEDGYVLAGSQGGDILLMKVSRDGDPLWRATFGGQEGGETATSVVAESDGYLLGATRTPGLWDYSSLATLIKTDRQGEQIWSMEGMLGSTLHALLRAQPGEYIFAGRRFPGTGSLADSDGGYVARYVNNGSSQEGSLTEEVFTHNRYESGNTTVRGVAVLDEERIALAGEYYWHETGDNEGGDRAVYLRILDREEIGTD